MKEISTSEAELAALMDDLEQMIKSADDAEATLAPEAPAEPVLETSEPTSAVVPVIEPAAPESAPETNDAEDETTVTFDLPSPTPEPQPLAATVTVSGLAHAIDVDKFREDTLVCDSNLDVAIQQHAGLRAYYNAQAAYAEAQAARSKAKFEVLESALYEQHKKNLLASGEKSTDKAIEAAMKTDPRWLKAKNMVIEAESIASVNKGLTFAMADRRDMLIQLGSDRREELKGGVRILAKDAENATMKEKAAAAARRAMEYHAT